MRYLDFFFYLDYQTCHAIAKT